MQKLSWHPGQSLAASSFKTVAIVQELPENTKYSI